MHPVVCQGTFGIVADPVGTERLQDLGLLVQARAVEEGANVLLSIRAGEARRIGVDGGMHTQADTGAFRDIFL